MNEDLPCEVAFVMNQYVKLMFRTGNVRESMYVKVISWENGEFTGLLDNISVVNEYLVPNRVIKFNSEHIFELYLF